MPQSRPDPWWSAPLVFALAAVVFSLYFDGLMLRPNLTAPTFGGDGLTIHYNLQYHAQFGEGVYLKSQYYPNAESVFMTDAHSVVAVVMAWLRPVFPGLAAYSTGISNVLIFWSNPLAALVLFLLLRRIGVRWPLAVAGGLLIAMMSPQILRQLGGQYTLGFTFLLPLTAWYMTANDAGKRYWLNSLGLAIAIILIGLNNPYLYAVAVSFLLGGAGVGIFLRWFPATRLPWKQLLSWVAVSVITTLAIILTLKYFDRVDDRVEVPFGFFRNIASSGGLITDEGTFPYNFVRRIVGGLRVPFRENRIYLGFVPIISGLLMLLSGAVPRVRRKVWKSVPPALPVLLGATVLGLVFAFGLPFIYFEEWTYAHLGSILQFRAPARFGWPFYYVLGLLTVYGLSRLTDLAAGKWYAWLVAAPMLFWAVEAHQFLNAALEDHIGPNAFTPSALDRYGELAADNGVDTSTFSSIYLLPTENGWSDKIHQDGSWRSNHDGYKLSLATGLPLLNGKLSRVGLSRVLQSLQIVSHPLVEKPLLDRLPAGKDILLLASAENVLSSREAGLFALGESVLKNDRVEMRRLSPVVLKNHVAEVRALALADTTLTETALWLPREGNSDRAFFGNGSTLVPAGWTELLNLPLDTLTPDSTELSLWVYADGSRFGGPKFHLRQLDANGKRITDQKAWSNATYDTQNGWLRVELRFQPEPGATRLELVSEHEFPFHLDAVLIRPVEGNVRREDAHGRILYNGFLIR